MTLDGDRYFAVDPVQRDIARELYQAAAHWPLLCPHGHVDPRLFADPDYHFGNPVELLIQPDHYVLRLLHSQGISYAALGIPQKGESNPQVDPRQVWQLFADHFYLYAATPSGLWLRDELDEVFGIAEPLNAENALHIYEAIQTELTRPDFTPQSLYQRFRIAALCTTDSPNDDLHLHTQIAASGWPGVILPTLRLDTLVHIGTPQWKSELEQLGKSSGFAIESYSDFLHAIEARRAYFKSVGATATDLGLTSALSAAVPEAEMASLFQQGLRGLLTEADVTRFESGLLMELARMSVDDGLVMQLHVGACRNHDLDLFERYGPDRGADFPIRVEFVRALQPLLNRFGNSTNFEMILFTMDESTYARELAPLASYYPAVKLGPPWWFNDSLNGMQRYLDQVVDACGIYNTVGFNDDTRAFLSIPARHDLWRRACANWFAGLVGRSILSPTTASEMMSALVCGLAARAYHLEKYLPA